MGSVARAGDHRPGAQRDRSDRDPTPRGTLSFVRRVRAEEVSMTAQQLSPAMTDSKHDSDLPTTSGAVPVFKAGADPGVVMDCRIKTLHYGNFLAVRDTDIPIVPNEITAFIGPSGCGKSTVLRSLNRMNDFVNGFRFTGSVHYRGQ